jgi:hypothetical protein
MVEPLLAKALLELDNVKAENIAWEYFDKYPSTWEGNSKYLNKKTEIFICGDLINFGYLPGTILHFRHDDTIHGTSEMFGNEPVFYNYVFNINKINFQLSYNELKQGKIKFEPKKN